MWATCRPPPQPSSPTRGLGAGGGAGQRPSTAKARRHSSPAEPRAAPARPPGAHGWPASQWMTWMLPLGKQGFHPIPLTPAQAPRPGRAPVAPRPRGEWTGRVLGVSAPCPKSSPEGQALHGLKATALGGPSHQRPSSPPAPPTEPGPEHRLPFQPLAHGSREERGAEAQGGEGTAQGCPVRRRARRERAPHLPPVV